MNFFKLYIGDYQRDTGTLSLTEHGAYLLMLQYFYATEAPLPKGRELYRLLRCETKTDREAVDVVVARFWQETETGLVCVRAQEEIEKSDNQRLVNREIGKRGGRPRKTEYKTESVFNSVPEFKTDSVSKTEPIDNPNQTPDTRHQTPEVKTKSARAKALPLPDWLPPTVWDDWETYRKRGKAAWTAKAAELSLRELGKLRDEGHDPQAVIEQSIQRGWTGLFPLKNQTFQTSPSSKNRQVALEERNAQVVRDWRPPECVEPFATPGAIEGVCHAV